MTRIKMQEVVIICIKNLLSASIEWIVVVYIMHNLVIILDDSLSCLLIPSDLIRHHSLNLIFGEFNHLILDVLSHFAMVNIEEVILGLDCSDSNLLWMSKIEIAL